MSVVKTVKEKLKWHEAGPKGTKKIIWREKEGCVSRQARITKGSTIAICRWHFVLQKVQVETSEHLELLNSSGKKKLISKKRS